MEHAVINRISKVYADSIGSELNIEVGDILLNINGQPISDIIEYRYYISEEYLEMDIQKPDGEIWTLEIEKDYDEDLGLEFENPIIDQSKNCQNQCIFCFIDQLPKDMRKTLYFKDDDSRLSFLQGNYITLTNMKKEEIQRIIDFRISPINLSVHATDPEVRKKMLNNKNAGNILSIMEDFNEHKIKMNCQIVLCPGVNDGAVLDQTIKDLKELDQIQSTAIVPVGLTKYREGLFLMKPYDQKSAQEVISQVQSWQNSILQEKNRRFVHLSDEFYILGNHRFPSVEDYEGFPQIENGVGLVTKFQAEIEEALSMEARKPENNLMNQRVKHPEEINKVRVQLVTGTLAKDFMEDMANKITQALPFLELEVVPIKNRFFGEMITVSGLVTGGDILETLKTRQRKEVYTNSEQKPGNRQNMVTMIPKAMLKAEENVFLDDLTVKDLEEELERKIVISQVEGKDFIHNLLEIAKLT